MTGRLSGAILAVTLITGAAMADGSEETVMRIGEAREIQFDGKPSTGYRWVLNEDGSTGLDAVTVEDLGYGETYTELLGASAPYRFRMTCEKSGLADLQFDYLAPDRSTVSATQTLSIRCE